MNDATLIAHPIPAIGETPDTMMRGSKMRIFPSKRQTQTMDLWRRRCIQLWNLLLSLEQAAYSGENTRSRLAWRSIWATVMEESHAEAVRVAREGKMRKNGTYRKAPGERKEPPPLDPSFIDKIHRRMNGAVEVDQETGEIKPAQPRLFIWEHELQKVMARLKQVPRTEWIADLPSHAAQSVVKDLIKALQAMLRERKKRASGVGGRDTGFPKFKKNRYAAGSVYFANTQLKFEVKRRKKPDGEETGVMQGQMAWVKLPNGVGWMECRIPRHIGAALHHGEAELMGGRIWRQGEEWFISCQWKLPKPAPLPPTGRTAGIKIAAGIMLTIHEEGRPYREFEMPPPDPDLIAAHRAAGKRQARALEAAKAKKKAKSEYRSKRHKAKLERGLTPKPPRIGMKLSPGFYAAAATLAKCEASDQDARDKVIHELTTSIVRQFDVISVQKMNVAGMMRKPSAERRLRRRQAMGAAKERASHIGLAVARKMMRRVAMARIASLLEYKMKDYRGEHAYIEAQPLVPEVQTCSRCGTKNPQMKDGRKLLRCIGNLPDGSACKAVFPRNRNAARNAQKRTRKPREKEA